MSFHAARIRGALPRQPVAAAVAAVLAVAAPAFCNAGTWVVDDSCADTLTGDPSSSSGTLRFCIANASDNDTIDLSQTTCSSISLQTGAITIAQSALTLHGPGKDKLALTGFGDRVFHITAADSNVTIDNLRIASAIYTPPTGAANGGCISSAGNLTLDAVAVYYCDTYSNGGSTLGGGIYAHGTLTIRNGSAVRYNSTYTTAANLVSEGGGVATLGALYVSDSTISDNSAHGKPSNQRVFGGGLTARNNVTITRSTIARNFSTFGAGGIDLFATTAGRSATISNSTVTQNEAQGAIGGIESNFAQLNIDNSTIVENVAANYAYGSPPAFYAPGVAVRYFAASGPVALSLQSSIIANNTTPNITEDLSTTTRPDKVTITGSNNIVRTYFADVGLPGQQGNLTNVCPLLGPLRDNGGPTLTQALLSHSPGLDAGNNGANDPITHAPATSDQRAAGYARVSGAVADIGAYEVQQDEIVFDAGFEGCPANG